mmetsp:Transcript_46979/g.92478  ORF Transcript_46979/g.92478 Transcript_46979/m.92478 type:complete len:222 (-) Transcript_46979:1234-1899(-)
MLFAMSLSASANAPTEAGGAKTGEIGVRGVRDFEVRATGEIGEAERVGKAGACRALPQEALLNSCSLETLYTSIRSSNTAAFAPINSCSLASACASLAAALIVACSPRICRCCSCICCCRCCLVLKSRYSISSWCRVLLVRVSFEGEAGEERAVKKSKFSGSVQSLLSLYLLVLLLRLWLTRDRMLVLLLFVLLRRLFRQLGPSHLETDKKQSERVKATIW